MATVGKQRTKKRRRSQGWGLALPQGHLAKPSTALATVSWGRGYRHPGRRPLPCAPADLAAGLILASTPLHSGPRSCHTDPAVRAAYRHTGVSGLSPAQLSRPFPLPSSPINSDPVQGLLGDNQAGSYPRERHPQQQDPGLGRPRQGPGHAPSLQQAWTRGPPAGS